MVSLQRGSTNATVIQLRGEIKQLLKEASSLSQWVFLEVYEKSFFNLTVEIHHITVCCQCHGHIELNCSDVYSFLFDMISFCLVSCLFEKTWAYILSFWVMLVSNWQFQWVCIKYEYNMICLFVNCRPSTFAQAAKLRRLAAAKEKELANCEAICNSTHPLYIYSFRDVSTFLKLSWI